MTRTTTLDVIQARANYELERELHPELPAWDKAPWLVRCRFLRAACGVRGVAA